MDVVNEGLSFDRKTNASNCWNREVVNAGLSFDRKTNASNCWNREVNPCLFFHLSLRVGRLIVVVSRML